MLRVFLSHSSQDKPFVRQLANFLERGDLAEPWLDEREIAPGENIVLKVQEGLENAHVALVILSPASVASNWVSEEWTAKFWQQVKSGKVTVVPVLYQDCKIPALLQNKKYFDLRTNHTEGFRQIRAWLLGLVPRQPAPVNLPEPPPLFVGREPQIVE